MAMPNYLTPRSTGWPHNKSWPQPSDRVRYIGDGTSVAKGELGSVEQVYEGDRIEVDFDNGTLLVCALSAVERA